MKINRLTVVLAFGGAVAFGLAACEDSQPANPPASEVEDCDAEDLANRETDCGFAPTTTRTRVTTTTRTTTRTR